MCILCTWKKSKTTINSWKQQNVSQKGNEQKEKRFWISRAR